MSEPLSFKKHFKQFGGDRSEAQHRSRYEKYLLSKAGDSGASPEDAPALDPTDIIIPPAIKDEDGKVVGYVQHKAFRQLVKGEELPEVVQQLIRPVFRTKGRSLLGTSGENLSQSLIERVVRVKRHPSPSETPPPPPPQEDTEDAD